MSDPRFDGSLDAPLARNSDALYRLVDPLDPRDVAPADATPLVRKRPRPTARRRDERAFEFDDVDDLVSGTDSLQLFTTNGDAKWAWDRATELMVTTTGWTHADDGPTLLAAAVMLADWSTAPIALFPDDGSRVAEVRARLVRDWIVVPIDRRRAVLRIAWVADEDHTFSFGLDALVAAGENVRRTWKGLYYSEAKEAWASAGSVREALVGLLAEVSGTVSYLSMRLQAAGVRSSYYANVYASLRHMSARGEAKGHDVGWGVMWSAGRGEARRDR